VTDVFDAKRTLGKKKNDWKFFSTRVRRIRHARIRYFSFVHALLK